MQRIVIQTVRGVQIDSSWLKLIKYIQENVDYGTINLEIKDGAPYEIKQAVKSIRF